MTSAMVIRPPDSLESVHFLTCTGETVSPPARVTVFSPLGVHQSYLGCFDKRTRPWYLPGKHKYLIFNGTAGLVGKIRWNSNKELKLRKDAMRNPGVWVSKQEAVSSY